MSIRKNKKNTFIMPKTKKKITTLLAKRMNADETTTKQWIDTYTEN